MAVFKCKMCGGALEINSGDTVAVCEYCNTKQPLPRLDDEKRTQLYDRANYFRRENEFDKAMGIYEMILSDAKEDCESYWGIVLCRYGIEYVEDPRSHKRIPTVNRAQFTSVFEDEDYKNAIKYADAIQKEVYEAEASIIDKIQRGILAISQKEEPFDVFICYKETDSLGNRTQDSVYAQDIYTTLTKEGYKVFFSKITLEDKLGSAYEPYIFAALNSAKVMLVVGTSKENFNAVWVKNEWSRYISLIKQGKEKTLIPVYKDISPYEMPEEFQFLQSQDMGKIGYLQDLIRGIKKIAHDTEHKTTINKEDAVVGDNANITPLLKRVFIFLEDKDWGSANEYCEKVLDIDPENAPAYVGKLMAELQVSNKNVFKNIVEPFDNSNNYQKIMHYGDAALKKEFEDIIVFIKKRNEAARKDEILARAKGKMSWEAIPVYESAINLFESISGWKDADEQILACREKIEELKAKEEAARIERERKAQISKEKSKKVFKGAVIVALCSIVSIVVVIGVLNTVIIPKVKYNDAIDLMEMGKYREAIVLLGELEDYKDSENYYSNALKIIADRNSVSAGNSHTVCLKSDGTVVAVGSNEYGQCNVEDWSDIVSVSTGGHRTIGMKSDGTIVIAGDCGSYEHDLRNYRDFVSVSSSFYNIVGLKSDGTVVVMNDGAHGEGDVQSWKGITAIATGSFHTVGLKSDATVVAVGLNDDGQCDVQNWRNIVAVSAHVNRTVGLKSDGTVVAVGDNEHGECNVSAWTDIVAIETTEYCTIGLKSDGTVLFAGINSSGQREVQNWTDIVEISANITHVVGLKSDGTVVAVGSDKYGQCDVSDWKNIKLPDNQ